jgi:hypothetical protein
MAEEDGPVFCCMTSGMNRTKTLGAKTPSIFTVPVTGTNSASCFSHPHTISALTIAKQINALCFILELPQVRDKKTAVWIRRSKLPLEINWPTKFMTWADKPSDFGQDY